MHKDIPDIVDDLLRNAGERVVSRLSSSINLTPLMAATIRRAARELTMEERKALAAAISARDKVVDTAARLIGRG